MRILVSWLRDFVTVDAGVQELADVLTMRGFEVSAIEPPPAAVQGRGDSTDKADDAVLDLEITTNRPDCLGVFGVAREISTVYDADLRFPELLSLSAANGDTGQTDVAVVIDDPELCPRYVAAVADVTLGPSPAWLAARLEAAGVRPINNVVDITNYVMLELGHPMHAFDLAALAESTLRIRRAAEGEIVRTLDGQNRALKSDMLVIADAQRPQAVAGVIGGAESEVTGGSRRIALESAYFRPTSVRSTGKRLALSTDASYRFERGADIEAPPVAMRRALTLLALTGAGQIAGEILDRYPSPVARRTVTLRRARIGRMLGVPIDGAFVSRTLDRLGFEVTDEGSQWSVTIPSFRVDVSREIDLIEEVARHFGYDRLPSAFPPLLHAPAPQGAWHRRQAVLRRVLTAAGCSEAITYGFIEREAAVPFARDLVAIANPLSEKYTVLRPSLIPGLVDSLIRNRRREHGDVRLFEIGRRFDRHLGETEGVAIALTGSGLPEHWSAPDRGVDLFDVVGVVEQACDALGVTPVITPVQQGDQANHTTHPALVEGRTAVVSAAGHELGYVGQLSPTLAEARGLPAGGDAVYVAELNLSVLAQVAVDRRQFTAVPVPRHPSIVRDLALLVDATLPAATVRDTIQGASPETLVRVREFDRYEGQGVPDGRVSLALHLTFRAADRTLTDAEVQTAVDKIVTVLEQQHGARLR